MGTTQTFLDANELVLNMGPQHPSTHGVLRVILKLDGEKVMGTDCVIGYLHRGVEKIAENRTYPMFAPYVDRMDYVAAVSNGLGYCLAIEKLMNLEAPPRAQSGPGDPHGTQPDCEPPGVARHARVGRRRDHAAVLHLARAGRGAEDFRGVLRSSPDHSRVPDRRAAVRTLRRVRRAGEEVLRRFRSADRRVRDIAHGQPDLGGKAQGSRDPDGGGVQGVRRHRSDAAGRGREVGHSQGLPYSGYEQYDFEIPTAENGDTYDRYIVRMEEMRQSVRIIRQAVAKIPEGPILAKVPKVIKPAFGEVYVSIEAPKGELGYYVVSDGTNHAVSHTGTAAVVHQFAVAGQDGERCPNCRCSSDHRYHRHCIGRSG
jgi:NADH-quinone oxidoreductase subunit D